ncbi:MAG TPA: hypothetical protein H9898_08930 [Candidatus Anaerobiospirillum stercoravium]|nr:hypothetical protein [Candidatus Anaerobiospirillum stercoravium]
MFQLNLKSRRSLSALVLSTVAALALTLTTACTVHDTDNYGYNNPPPAGHKAPPRGQKPRPAQPPQHQGQRPAHPPRQNQGQPPRPARDGRYDSLISGPGQEYNGYPNRPAQPPR